MTLLWCDSLDGYGINNNTAPAPTGIVAAKYGQVNNESLWRIRSDSGSAYPYTMQMSVYTASMQMQTPDITTNLTTIAGVNFWYYQGHDMRAKEEWPLFRFANDSDEECAAIIVQHKPAYFVRDGSGNYVGGCRINATQQIWNYVEMKVYSHLTEGTIEVRVNGCPVFFGANLVTATANGTITRVGLGGNFITTPAGYSQLDNFYVCDGDGSTNNDFLGRVTIEALHPDGDDTVNWSVTGNVSIANNYGQVNSNLAKPTTDYVEEETTGNRDSYSMDDVSADFDTIYAVVAVAHAKYDTNATTIKFVLTSNGTDAESANIALTTSLKTELFVVEEDPDSSNAWTPSTVNALLSGYEVV
jgi:hypothetical protein